ncbi:hypothetical protein HDU80_008540 [Chytriomyces hyalinus]|nr:hypothetical protein HDU80_008540 [Chytriomyces hyalinus]
MSNATLDLASLPLETPPILTFPQSIAFALVSGLTIEISCGGLITAASQYFQDGKASQTLVVMTVFNIIAIVYSSIVVWGVLLGADNCILGELLAVVCAQLFFVTFDIFMLMKTYAVSAFDRTVLIGCIGVGIYRVCWGIADAVKSHGAWDADLAICSYIQHPVTGIGYNSADIIVDTYSTVVALAFNWKHLKTSLSQIRKVLIQENYSFSIYAALVWTDQFNILMAYLAQNYMYTRCMNAESVFKTIRKKASSTMHGAKPSNSAPYRSVSKQSSQTHGEGSGQP